MNTEYIERKFRHIEFLFQDFFGCSGTDPNFEGFCSNLNGFVKHQDVFRRQEAMLKEVGDGGGVPRSTVYIYISNKESIISKDIERINIKGMN